MAITSGFFDSINGDRLYTAEEMSSYFDGIVSDGVYESVGGRFNVTAGNGLTINVADGRAIIQSHWIKNDAQYSITLDPADIQLGRIDAIALRLDKENRFISLYAKKGTPASSPQMPEITRTDTVWELYIALVYIAKGATQPTLITDLRPSIYCGWVTGVVQQVNTADLFDGWNAAYQAQYAKFDAYMDAKMQAFNEWFETLTKQLTVQTGVTKYEYRQTVGPGSSAATVDIPEYDMQADVLLVFVDGAYVTERYDYTIKPPTRIWPYPAVTFRQAFTKSTKITMVVLKNVPGENVISVGAAGRSTATLFGTSSYVAGEAQTEPET